MEKKKTNQPVEPEPMLSCKNVIAVIAIIISLVIIGVPCAIFIAFGLPDYYREKDVLLTCQQLHLTSDSEFCESPTRSQPDDLEATLLKEYPLHETSISELVEHWDVEFILTYDPCEESEVSMYAVCPMQNSCGDYTCVAGISPKGVTIWLDSQGSVTRYGISDID